MKGIYALKIRLNKDASIKVGALGNVHFKKGNYVYVGSAQRNLEKRVERHLQSEKKLFWHIDYFLCDERAKIKEVVVRQAGKPAECELAQELLRQGEPVYNFGCSDCQCQSHLFWFPKIPSLLEQEVIAFSHGWSRFDIRDN